MSENKWRILLRLNVHTSPLHYSLWIAAVYECMRKINISME
jgi:hypothetical protein